MNFKSLLCVIIFLSTATKINAEGLTTSTSDSINKGRVLIISSSLGAILYGSYYYIENAWWSDKQTNFHFDNGADLTYALNVDKVGHFMGGLEAADIFSSSMKWAGMSNKQSLWYGAFFGSGLQLAIEMKDAVTVAKYLDDNIHIVMNLTMSGETQLIEFDKAEYIKTLKEGWDVTEEYTYTRDKVTIEYIGNGNKAVVTANVYELSVVAGQPIAALSQEKMLVEFRADKPIVVNLTANTEVRM